MKPTAFLFLLPATALAGQTMPLGEWSASKSDEALVPLGTLFGSIAGLFPGAAAGVLTPAIKTLNLFIFALAAFIIAWKIFSTVIDGAHTGRLMRGNGSWGTIRAVVGAAMMVPAFSGYCLAQLLCAWAVMVGVGVANMAHTGAAPIALSMMTASFPTPLVRDPVSVGRQLLDAAVCAQMHNASMKRLEREMDADAWSAVNGDLWTSQWSPSVTSTNDKLRITYGECGGVETAWADPGTGAAAPILSTVRRYQQSALNVLAGEVWAITSTDTPDATTIVAVETAVLRYREQLEKQLADAIKNTQLQYAAAAKAATAQKSWLAAGSISMATASAAVSVANATPTTTAVSPAKNSDSLRDRIAEGRWLDAIAAAGTVLKSGFDFAKNAVGETANFAAAVSNGEIWGMISTWIDRQARELARIFAFNPTATAGGGVASLAGFGAKVVGWASAALAAWIVLAALIGTLQGTGVAAISAAGGLISSILTAVIGLGAMLSSWLPFLPSLYWTVAVVAYLLMAVEAIAAAPLWALMHLDLDEAGAGIPTGARHGYLSLANLILRPTLLVIFMLAAQVLYDWSLGFLGGLIQSGITSAIAAGTGLQALAAAIGGLFFYVIACATLAAFVFGYIMTGPDKVLATIQAGFSSAPAPHSPHGGQGAEAAASAAVAGGNRPRTPTKPDDPDKPQPGGDGVTEAPGMGQQRVAASV